MAGRSTIGRRSSDPAIVNAFRKLPDATGWDHPKHWLAGGNIQLSREFATFAKGDPDRAARLLAALDPACGTRAAGYTLDALAEAAEPRKVLDMRIPMMPPGYSNPHPRIVPI